MAVDLCSLLLLSTFMGAVWTNDKTLTFSCYNFVDCKIICTKKSLSSQFGKPLTLPHSYTNGNFHFLIHFNKQTCMLFREWCFALTHIFQISYLILRNKRAGADCRALHSKLYILLPHFLSEKNLKNQNLIWIEVTFMLFMIDFFFPASRFFLFFFIFCE